MNFKWLFASLCVSLGQTGASFQSSLAKVKIGLVRRWERGGGGGLEISGCRLVPA